MSDTKMQNQTDDRTLKKLEQELAEAWWNEAPLEQIERLEAEIADRSRKSDPSKQN